MFLTLSEFDKFFKCELEIDFAEIVLKQQTINKPKIYKGPGSIYQDRDGTLHLKIYHKYRGSKSVNVDLMNAFGDSDLTPGKIISNDNYYKMTAKDVQGRMWTSNNIWIRGHMSMPTSTYVIKAALKEINRIIKRNTKSTKQQKFQLYTPLLKRIPFNKSKTTESGTSLSICELNLGKKKLTIEKFDTHLLVEGTVPVSSTSRNHAMIALEALSIVTGIYIVPMISIITNRSTINTTVRSFSKAGTSEYIQSPIPTNFPSDSVYLQSFLKHYIGYTKTPKSSLFGYWYRINQSFNSDLESKALVVTTCIEGLLKTYYPEYGLPDPEYLDQVDDAKKALKTIQLGQRVRDRILSSLGGKKSSNTKNSLYQMVSEGMIDQALADTWVDTRNKAAHASELKKSEIEIQLLINGIYSCLELFYLLILVKLQYSGKYYCTSKEGWPEGVL